MGGRIIETIKGSETTLNPPMNTNASASARNLRKGDLGGVIFGCKNSTMKECLSKQLFGLPSPHFSYVMNIEPGLPLFLFNYSDRNLHGIYEAASVGKMNIDPYAWTDGGIERTSFPAQVLIFKKIACQPLSENQYKKIIKDNYYNTQHFWFELDHAQTKCLIALFKSISVGVNARVVPIATSKDNLYIAVPNVKWKVVSSSGHKKSELCEPEKNSIHVNAAKGNTHSSLCRDDIKYDCASSSRTSSIAIEDRELRAVASDWENGGGNETLQLSQSSLSGESSTYLEQHSGSEVLGTEENTEIPMAGQRQVKDSDDEGLNNEEKAVLLKLRKLAAGSRHVNQSSNSCADNNTIPCVVGDRYAAGKQSANEPSGLLEVKHTKQFGLYNGDSGSRELTREFKERVAFLEKKQVESDHEIHQLRDVVKELKKRIEEQESKYNSLASLFDDRTRNILRQYMCSEEVIYLIGGFDGTSWLSTLDSFSPSMDIVKPLRPMSSARSYASAVALNGNIYVFGGGDGVSWYNTVECYNPRDDEWSLCSPLSCAKGSLAGATLDDKIYAIGGGDGLESFPHVEMFDPVLGSWLNSPPMLQKRFAPAAAELHRVLYAVGGYDGKDYLLTAERYDPREAYWTRIPSMQTKRGCHSMAVFNDKLYAMGGYDGDQMVSSVEVFDPRLGCWLMDEPMNCARGYATAAVIGTTLLAMGGIQDGVDIVGTVECYREGTAWAHTGLNAIGKRCFLSTVVI